MTGTGRFSTGDIRITEAVDRSSPEAIRMEENRTIEAHLDRFVEMLDARFRQYGAPDGLAEALRQAVRASPRHRFVHCFTLGGLAVHDADTAPEAHLATIYDDVVLMHVDRSGEPLRSSNSQPSFVLWLLDMLAVEPGQRVLEIGSGCGWLVALMSRLVGAQGCVTGIEIIEDLAERSRRDLAALGIENVTILTGDGSAGTAGGPFDRVMVTAATWDITDGLLGSVAEGGYLLVPILTGWDDACAVLLLRKEGDELVAERGIPGLFVPLVGAGQQPERGDPISEPVLGTPAATDSEVVILRACMAPKPSANLTVEPRGESVLVRRYDPDIASA